MKEEVVKLLIEEALRVRQMAYAPYSHYLVGAALVVPSGRIYTGCNVENSSYGLTNCAERTAVFKAVSEGQRHIDAIAIVGGPLGDDLEDVNELDQLDTSEESEKGYAYPCGACRQVLAEFLPESGDIDIIVAKNTNDYKIYKLSELIPMTFKI